MRYIKTQEEFIKEEFILNALKKAFGHIKSKVALEWSKKIGSAKKIDDLMVKYQTEIMKQRQPKLEALRAIGELEKQISNGGAGDDASMKKLVLNLQNVTKKVDQLVENTKKKYDEQIDNIIKDEKNDKVQEYIKLKKYDIAEFVIKSELDIMTSQLGLTDDDINKSPTLKKIMEERSKALLNIEDEKRKVEDGFNNTNNDNSEDGSEFNTEEASKNKYYEWDSKFKRGEYKFKTGEEIKHWSIKEADLVTAYVVDPKETDNVIKPKNDEIMVNRTEDEVKGSYIIKKGKIASTKLDDEEKIKNSENKDNTNQEDTDIKV